MQEKLRNINNTVRTTSIWPEPTQNFFRFLRRIEHTGLPKTLAILGCADGTYVIHAAKRGFNILAIDRDIVALYGGTATLYGKDRVVMGLAERLAIEQLETKVKIVCDDFIFYNEEKQEEYSGVFTSGSIHYEDNFCYPLKRIVESIQSYVTTRGLLLIEYIHCLDQHNDPEKYFTGKEIMQFFPRETWHVSSNKKKNYIEAPNPRNSKTHTISWGKLYAQKIT